MISLEEAIEKITSARAEWGVETVKLEHALGRVLAEDVVADRDYPPFNRATMDGYAVKFDDVHERRFVEFRIAGELFAGDGAEYTLHTGEALKIMTGAPVPDSADAVIKKEEADEHLGDVRFTAENYTRHQNIARRGEDGVEGDIVLPTHRQIRFGHLSLLAAVGKSSVEVVRLPRVAVISTGNEIQPVTGTVAPHQIRDSNAWSIAGFLKHYSIEPAVTAIVRDTMDGLTRLIESVLDCDIVIVSGGVSAGDADLVPAALAACGVREIFHGVKIKPGKPLWFGVHPGGMRVFALPGNPFSVQTACRIFIRQYLRACLHLPVDRPLRLPLGEDRKKRTPFDEFFPAALGTHDVTHIVPVPYHTSGDITVVAGSDGIALHPDRTGDLAAGETVELFLWNA